MIYYTKNNNFWLEFLNKSIKISSVDVDYGFCSSLCKTECGNYHKKYSCPPLATSFSVLSEPYKYMVVSLVKVNTESYNKIYNTVRMINVVEKSIQRKIFDEVLINLKDHRLIALKSGSCRLCRKCNFQKNLPCKHPDKMRFSLEATGVNVNKLALSCFDFPLQWYYKGKQDFPEYLCVVGGILTNNPNKVLEELDFVVSTDYLQERI